MDPRGSLPSLLLPGDDDHNGRKRRIGWLYSVCPPPPPCRPLKKTPKIPGATDKEETGGQILPRIGQEFTQPSLQWRLLGNGTCLLSSRLFSAAAGR